MSGAVIHPYADYVFMEYTRFVKIHRHLHLQLLLPFLSLLTSPNLSSHSTFCFSFTTIFLLPSPHPHIDRVGLTLNLLTRIQEGLGSNLATGYSDWGFFFCVSSQYLLVTAGRLPSLGHNRILPNSSQFIIHLCLPFGVVYFRYWRSHKMNNRTVSKFTSSSTRIFASASAYPHFRLLSSPLHLLPFSAPP
jgi:hypothetical protein